MSNHNLATWSFVVASLLIGASCGSSDSGSADVTANADTAGGDTATTIEAATGDSDDGGDSAEAGFGELIEGTFILSGALDESYYVSDPDFAFRLGGGCQGSAFGVSINVTDAEATTSFAMITAEMQQDISGGATGEFEAVDATVTVFPGGDTTKENSFSGPLRMIVSEHNTGGLDASLNERRMTIDLLGSLPSDAGDLDVDASFRWVMGCP